MKILQTLKHLVLKEIFDKEVELNDGDFYSSGNQDIDTSYAIYRTEVQGELYKFNFSYDGEGAKITISFKPETGGYSDMFNDNRVYDVMARIKFFAKQFLKKIIRPSYDTRKPLTIEKVSFMAAMTDAEASQRTDAPNRKRTRLYIALFKKMFRGSFDVIAEGENIFIVFDKPMTADELLKML